MTPQLARRGKLIACAGALLACAGAINAAWPLVALGTVVLAGLATAQLVWYPSAILLRRRKVELAWWVPPGDQPGGAMTAGRVLTLHVAIRNHGTRPLHVHAIELIHADAIEGPPKLGVAVPAAHEVELRLPLRPRAAGTWHLHGARLRLGDLLGLFELTASFPNPLALKVFPPVAAPRGARLVPPSLGALDEHAGAHIVRQRGVSGDLRELRDHQVGDPFKSIAWKATARKRRLLVRELENEIVVTNQLLVDVGGPMRDGPPGRARLDWAIELSAALARQALDHGDRAGLVTWDTRVVAQVKAGEGRPHLLPLMDRLIEAQTIVDDDLTDLTDGELAAAVASYLAHQEALDVRLRRVPPIGDPAWDRVATGPKGELYDLAALGRILDGLLAADQGTLRRPRGPVTVVRAQDPEMGRLRAFCRARGIALPYRRWPTAGARSHGLAEALARATHGERGNLILVLTDLAGLADDLAVVSAAVGRARQQRHRLVFITPSAAAFGPTATTEAGRTVAEILAAERAWLRSPVVRTLVGMGASVVEAEPTATPAELLRRAARGRSTRGRAA